MSQDETTSDTDSPWRNEETLRKLYREERLPVKDITEQLGCSKRTLYTWIDRHGIERNQQGPWRGPETLRAFYHEEGMSVPDIAKEFDCAESTVWEWMRRHEIEKRHTPTPWTDEELLRDLYIEQKLSSPQIAERLDCSPTTIRTWLERHGIGVRDQSEANRLRMLRKPPNYYTDKDGYCHVQTKHRGKRYSFLVHRLVAVAEWGIEAVKDQLVHHKNEVPWDNRPSNLELVSDTAIHVRMHGENTDEADNGLPWRDREVMERLYVEERMSVTEISEELDCVTRTVEVWLQEFGLKD